MQLSKDLTQNKQLLKSQLPVEQSFDYIQRNFQFLQKNAYWLGISGFCKTEDLQDLFSNLQNTDAGTAASISDIHTFIKTQIGLAGISLSSSTNEIGNSILSGLSALFIDGFDQAILIDMRSYPVRGISEPDAERTTGGSRDGFVETLLTNTNLIRRRVRSTNLIFEMHTVGDESHTEIVLTYLHSNVNQSLLTALRNKLDTLHCTSLTMGSKSLEELLVKKRWWNPLPAIRMTERPDVACSYLLEGHILLLVDNSPLILILPSTIFQFTQSPEDYYKSPIVGNYFRLIRFACILISMLLLPEFLLICIYYPQLAADLQLLSTENLSPPRLIFYVCSVELLLDLFKYSGSVNSGKYSGSLSIVGGLLIGDIAVSLNWASAEVLFYAAVTLLCTLSLPSVEFADGLRIYRIFLIIITAVGGLYGFIAGLTLVSLSIATTPTFGGMSYLWPLFPFNGSALYKLLFRAPTYKAQPSTVWDRGKTHSPS